MSGYFQLRSWQQNLLFLTRCQDILSCVCGDKAGCILLSLRDIFGRICRDKIIFFFHKMLSISQSFSWQHKQGFSTSCRDIFRPAYSDRTGCVFFFFFLQDVGTSFAVFMMTKPGCFHPKKDLRQTLIRPLTQCYHNMKLKGENWTLRNVKLKCMRCKTST